jgi:hypothetical protein
MIISASFAIIFVYRSNARVPPQGLRRHVRRNAAVQSCRQMCHCTFSGQHQGPARSRWHPGAQDCSRGAPRRLLYRQWAAASDGEGDAHALACAAADWRCPAAQRDARTRIFTTLLSQHSRMSLAQVSYDHDQLLALVTGVHSAGFASQHSIEPRCSRSVADASGCWPRTGAVEIVCM